MATGIRAERGSRAGACYGIPAMRAPGADPGRVRWFCQFCPLTVRLCVSCWVERVAEHRASEARFDRCLAEVVGHADAALR